MQARDININEIVKNQIKQNKHLFIFLHQTGCGYCESMIEFTLDDEAVKKVIKKNFIYVHINIKEKDSVTYENFKGSGREFANYVGYNFYPSSLFIDKHNELVYSIAGYKDEKDFLDILKYVSSKSYDEF